MCTPSNNGASQFRVAYATSDGGDTNRPTAAPTTRHTAAASMGAVARRVRAGRRYASSRPHNIKRSAVSPTTETIASRLTTATGTFSDIGALNPDERTAELLRTFHPEDDRDRTCEDREVAPDRPPADVRRFQ